jgi:uncharacterized YccA/Bax inhibitor family protein
MELFKSGNPTLSEKRFTDSVSGSAGYEVMTVRGTLHKFGLLFLVLMSTSFYSWVQFDNGANVVPMIWIGAIGGLVVALILMFKKHWAPFLAPVYALLEGLFLGAVSAMYNYTFAETAPNLVMNSVLLTFGVCAAMYLLFSSRIIKVTNTFRSIMLVATAGIAIFYLIAMVLRMTGVAELSFIHEGTTFGILFSVFIVAIAALNLILDFDMIEKGAEAGAPKYMEWFGAFGLMVTIIWLYLEILRLLSKISSRK